MEKDRDYDIEIYFDDDVMSDEIIMKEITREQEEKLQNWECGVDLPVVITEDAFLLLIETAGEE